MLGASSKGEYDPDVGERGECLLQSIKEHSEVGRGESSQEEYRLCFYGELYN